MRYFVRFSYIGTDFHGSQTQPNAVTVQEVLEQAFFTIMRTSVSLTFAGRTDAGVHAEEMYAHFDIDNPIDTHNMSARLNNLLPHSIAVYDIFPVKEDLHARFSAKARTYEYRIVTYKSPFLHGRTARLTPNLDVDTMNEAASLLLGKHDFASFCRVHTDVKTTLCNITHAQWTITHNPSPQQPSAIFTITADRFLRNMVRAIVGTMLDIGRHKISAADFQTIIHARNRCAAGQSAPAEGLFLTHIEYDF
ncbi:MAG: tRNA pseudouridine(38-40) synthase TruA [Paludibacteraceae bacterium]|nr:tRNA pseudouridine(38-40) synthase TruA [Paludibacteraceae bacterium]